VSIRANPWLKFFVPLRGLKNSEICVKKISENLLASA